jgi:hypothetical protein
MIHQVLHSDLAVADHGLAGGFDETRVAISGTSSPQQTLIAEAVDLVIFVDEESAVPAGRKVREVLLVTGYSNGEYAVERV